ncbi:hypothetical protein GGF44_000348 [Coemansia sp. RSA 1694]|nr:hypothetical protein GGF38_000520 [Coemansia sp. RSA 25]KAJ2507955.1 hypothetical protein IWW47_000857 [Coemansia sp. RSA 2052]KAJ2644888.1 hypothetical protein GGF44_000348 [Coemansia sp. RSA 1694]
MDKTAEDYMYDDKADERDAAWAESELQLQGSATDAVLSCPQCLVQICFVCQRHARFKDQYRALSVQHCTVREEDLFVYGGPHGLLERKSEATPKHAEVFRLVECSRCQARVGVADAHGTFHLFGVVAGM